MIFRTWRVVAKHDCAPRTACNYTRWRLGAWRRASSADYTQTNVYSPISVPFVLTHDHITAINNIQAKLKLLCIFTMNGFDLSAHTRNNEKLVDIYIFKSYTILVPQLFCNELVLQGSNLPALVNKIMKGQFAPIRGPYSPLFKQVT